MATKKPYIDYHADNVEPGKLPAKLVKLATEGIELDIQIKALSKRQNEIKDALKKEIGEGTKLTLVVPGVGTVPLVPKEEVVVSDPNRLAEVLDQNFAQFVETKLSYKPLQPLVDLVYEPGKPMHDLIKEACAIKNSCAISFKAEK
jgi:hypothetical protein